MATLYTKCTGCGGLGKKCPACKGTGEIPIIQQIDMYDMMPQLTHPIKSKCATSNLSTCIKA